MYLHLVDVNTEVSFCYLG